MIRLAIATVILAVALVVVKRRQAKNPTGEVLRVASRTGISRGVMAAVLEVEQRRFLVTITPTSTTLVAELGPTGVPLMAAAALDIGASHDVAFPVAPAPPLPAGAVAPSLASPLPAPAPDAGNTEASIDGGFLDRLRARTVRTYDAELVAAMRAER